MTRNSRPFTTGIILLATQDSGRFSHSKYRAPFQGGSFLRQAAETALRAALGPVNVVVSEADPHFPKVLTGLEVNILRHPARFPGESGAIATGIRPWLGRKSQPDGVILLHVCQDQPKVSAAHLQTLAEVAASRLHSIVATACGNGLEAPAWFAADKFFRLLLLDGRNGNGLESLIAREPRLHRLELPPAALEMNTEMTFRRPLTLSAAFGNDHPKPRAA